MARRILITRRDWMQHADAGFTAGIGVWRLPLANMLDARPQVVAEAVDNRDWNSTKFDADLGGQRKVGMIWFAGLRATSLGLITIKAGLDATFASNAYEVAASCWPQDSAAGEYNNWNEWTLNGVYLEDEYVKLGFPRFFIPPAQINCRYIRVEIRDSSAVDPLQIGCFGASEVYEPPIGFAYDWQITSIDQSDVQSVPMGATYIDQRGTRRRLSLGFQLVDEDEAWTRAFGLTLIKGRSEPLVVVPFSDNAEITRLEKAAVYGLISTDSPLSNPFVGIYAQPWQVDQLY